MSGALSTILPVFGAVADWRNDLQPASFRGVPFEVDALEGEGGRRIVVFEFPGRDTPYTEDLGRAAQHHRIRGFVLGNDYMAQRDELLAALQDDPDPGVLIHPTLGRLTVRVGAVRWVESKERGGGCAFDVEFIEDGPTPSPITGIDTISAGIRGAISLARLALRIYRRVSLIISDPLYVLSRQGGILGLLATAFRALPAGSISGASTPIAAIAAAPADDEATIAAISGSFAAVTATVIATRTATPVTGDAVTGTETPGPADSDPSGGLIALASFGDDLPPIAGTTAQARAEAIQQDAILSLIRALALASVVEVYASIPWPHAQAAQTARRGLLALFDAQAQAAADAGLDDLYRGLGALESAAMADMTARAQALPRLERYALLASLPSDVLVWRLYQDPARMRELEDLNRVGHPLFMPEAGLWLVVA